MDFTLVIVLHSFGRDPVMLLLFNTLRWVIRAGDLRMLYLVWSLTTAASAHAKPYHASNSSALII
jgi:hypothetical protein